MPEAILTTKLAIPLVRADLVARPRLAEKLNRGLRQGQGYARRLTLVSAPAGFGKTTLVAAWMAGVSLTPSPSPEGRGGQPVTPHPSLEGREAEAITGGSSPGGAGAIESPAWVALDEGDNDPARFLTYVIAALRQAAGPSAQHLGAASQAMLSAPQPPPAETLLTALINDLAHTPGLFILALDDYHAIHNPHVHHLTGFLLEHLPASMHMVILTREDPLLPISRLRARGQVCEIRETDLRFTPPEAARFLSQALGAPLPQDDLDTLLARTEGWATGLQLAALALQAHLAQPEGADAPAFIASFAGSNRYVLDYLFEEVFARQPAEAQEFLVQTSILERLSAGLCDAVTGRADGSRRLEALERANLFITPLDAAREWYRYHHLFADLLRHQLRRQKEPPEAQLHRRAGEWLEGEGYLEEAIRHALAAQDWAAATRRIGQASTDLLKRGEIATLIGWYDRLPREAACAHPALCLTFAWALLLASQFEAAAPLLEQAEKMAPPESPALGQAAAAQAYLARARGDNALLIEKSRQALAWLPQADGVSRGNVALNLGLAYWHAGRLDEAEAALREAQASAAGVGNTYALLAAQIFLARTQASRGKLHLAAGEYQKLLQAGGEIPILALAHYDLSCIHFEWNELDQASEHLQRGLELSSRSGNVEFQISGHIQRAALAQAQGKPGAARQAAEQALSLAQGYPPATQARSAACRLLLALAQNDPEAIEKWAGQAGRQVDAHSFYRFLGLAPARLLLARGHKEAAAAELEACQALASQGGWGYAAIAARTLQALAAESAEAGLGFLADALRRASPEGFLRTFAEAGPGLAPLLEEAARRGIEPDYAGKLLAALGRARSPAGAERAGLPEPLSERELEVLRLVAAGLSNREIARKLFISPGTAKTHIHNLCGKLGVSNRTAAAMRARELGLA